MTGWHQSLENVRYSRAEETDHPVSGCGHHCGHHHRLGDFCVSGGNPDAHQVNRFVHDHVGHLRSLQHPLRPVLRWARSIHASVRRGVCLHSTGIWRLSSVCLSMDQLPADLSGGDCCSKPHCVLVHLAALVSRLWSASCSRTFHCHLYILWVWTFYVTRSGGPMFSNMLTVILYKYSRITRGKN